MIVKCTALKIILPQVAAWFTCVVSLVLTRLLQLRQLFLQSGAG